MTPYKSRPYYFAIFTFFLISGFCGLLYQIVWIRLAFASFGVITPILSVVISVFMLGLALGSWAGGKYIARLTALTGAQGLEFYSLAELLIGVGGILVPMLFSFGQSMLLQAGNFNSFKYLLLSAFVLAASILPWCIFMGATFPCMASFVKKMDRPAETAFSYLYLANVIGAMLGVILTASFFIELFGMHRTLFIAVFLNFGIAIAGLILNRQYLRAAPFSGDVVKEQERPVSRTKNPGTIALILFMTGFISMSMEVVWTRAFTPILSTTIYSFAAILVVYLAATWIGSWRYRRHSKLRKCVGIPDLMAYLAVFCLLPVMLCDPRLQLNQCLRIFAALAGIFPFCAVLGYLTPKLIDEYSAGGPKAMGKIYAINIIGCILGPLFAAYLLLPALGIRFSLVILSAPLIICYARYFKHVWSRSRGYAASAALLTIALLLGSVKVFLSYEDTVFYNSAVVRRDYTATVISFGEGMKKRLLVNGIGMTSLTTITKWMVHMPLAIRDKKPSSALIICLGMGTSFRSAASWGIDTTAVELVPSVRDAFGFYFKDADEVLRKPNTRIIVDDGRRFLMRTAEKFDIIAIDPPPPVEASCSGLLYSRDFYRTLKLRLKEGGIMAQWLPPAELVTVLAVARSIRSEFPFVRVFFSCENFGLHFFASEQPFEMPKTKEFVSRLPRQASRDLIEWTADKDPAQLYSEMLKREIPLAAIPIQGFKFSITDDRPFNEYYFIRRTIHKLDTGVGGAPK